MRSREVTAELDHTFAAASGLGLEACHFIGLRYDLEEGFRPGRGESFLCRLESGRMRVHLGGACWLTDVFQADDGAVFVSEAHHGVYVGQDGETFRHFDLPGTTSGVGGWAGHVFAWGLAPGGGPSMWRWTGSGWDALVAPGFVSHVAGRGHAGFAVGRAGRIARFQAGRWIPMDEPVGCVLSDVTMRSEDEAYATALDGSFLVGSSHGWSVACRHEQPLLAVAASAEQVWVGADYPAGLMRWVDGSLESERRSFDVRRIDARGRVLVTTTTDLLELRGGDIAAGFTSDAFAEAIASIPVERP